MREWRRQSKICGNYGVKLKALVTAELNKIRCSSPRMRYSAACWA
ncbi:hypothetical protein CAMGR0001_1371 [Campylobacter gracilis RM3268]|uniref:Uncharacterized protein n=1 Tax=Campylobacter gracilis RM3268 TaxID=553220 RepID=C8PJH1_9BACT|nr:hypothetical protein CAMGR0001_1371 [Campylobacter gracilis RM3268]